MRRLTFGASGAEQAEMKTGYVKLLRKVSRTATWVVAALIGVIFLSDPITTLSTVPTSIIGLGVALFAIATAVYFVLLRMAQGAAKREIEELLRSGHLFADDAGPLVLFLRSFEVAKSSIGARVSTLMYILLEAAFFQNGDGIRVPYDIDEKLDDAVAGRGMLVAIGNKHVSYGSAKLTVRDEDWKDMFRTLTKAAKLIVMLPGPSASVLWEISQLLSERSALAKTVFAMPRQDEDRPLFWARTAASVESELGLKLPDYKARGCYFKISPEDHAVSAVELEAFTRALAGHLKKGRSNNDGAFDPSELWKAARNLGATTLEANPAPDAIPDRAITDQTH
jgi:hypothetical protein